MLERIVHLGSSGCLLKYQVALRGINFDHFLFNLSLESPLCGTAKLNCWSNT